MFHLDFHSGRKGRGGEERRERRVRSGNEREKEQKREGEGMESKRRVRENKDRTLRIGNKE